MSANRRQAGLRDRAGALRSVSPTDGASARSPPVADRAPDPRFAGAIRVATTGEVQKRRARTAATRKKKPQPAPEARSGPRATTTRFARVGGVGWGGVGRGGAVRVVRGLGRVHGPVWPFEPQREDGTCVSRPVGAGDGVADPPDWVSPLGSTEHDGKRISRAGRVRDADKTVWPRSPGIIARSFRPLRLSTRFRPRAFLPSSAPMGFFGGNGARLDRTPASRLRLRHRPRRGSGAPDLTAGGTDATFRAFLGGVCGV